MKQITNIAKCRVCKSSCVAQRQHGVSLIELMVTLTLVSFLMLGVVEFFSSNLRTANVTQNLGVSAEGGGFGSLLLSRYLRYAGHDNFFHASEEVTVINKVNVENSSNNNGASGAFDEIMIEYEAPEESIGIYTSCAGLAVIPGSRVRESFQVDANNYLSCTSLDFGSGETANSPLIQGVQMFQVEYGLAKDVSSQDVSRYVSAAQLPDQAQVNDTIRAIRFQLLVNAGHDQVDTTPTNYQLFDASKTVAADAAYRVFGTTVAVNNAARGRIIQ